MILLDINTSVAPLKPGSWLACLPLREVEENSDSCRFKHDNEHENDPIERAE